MNIEKLLEQAVTNNTSIETVERLLSVGQQIKEEQAKSDYFKALSEFQSECPIIKKSKEVKVNGQVRYRYAPLEDIIKQALPLLKKHGFSFTFKTVPATDHVKVCCDIHHDSGYAQDSCMSIQIDPNSFMSDAQKAGSASTFAKRYAFCNALGISTGDEDDDGASVGGGITAQDLFRRFAAHMTCVLDNIHTVIAVKDSIGNDDYETAADAWAEINDYKTLKNLYLAPTKGGCFTVDERRKMESDKFKELYARFREGQTMEGL